MEKVCASASNVAQHNILATYGINVAVEFFIAQTKEKKMHTLGGW
jgi:hypothetical protein